MFYQNQNNWIKKCQEWKQKWQYTKESCNNNVHGIDLYYFTLALSENLSENSCIVSDAGSAYYVACQSLRLPRGARYITTNSAEMGAAIPLAIGASIAKDNKEVLVITGDGSFNAQVSSLGTVQAYKLPIKIFVWNNSGYLSIKNTQKNMFGGRVFGTDNQNGLYFPSLEKIANTYNFKYYYVSQHNILDNVMKNILNKSESILCEVICNPNQIIAPSAAFEKVSEGIKSLPLWDMTPRIDPKELAKEMIN